MAKFEKRLAALKLRRRGYSIRSIASHLQVSKSSASIWCRDLQLTKKQELRLIRNAIRAGHRGRMIGAKRNREKKEEQIEFYRKLAEREVAKLTKRDLLIAGAALYWAEGNKKSKFAFTNSEPQMIKFMSYWFQRILGVKKDELMPRIFINAIHEPRIKKVIIFWSRLLRVPTFQFGKPVFLRDRPKKIYEKYHSYYGVLTLGVRKSAKLKYRVLGLIDALRNERILPV